MKVFLLQDVKGVGRRFEVKNVPDGFGRNFLIARKLAEPYTDATDKKVSKLREEAARDEAKTEEEYKIIADLVKDKTLVIKGKANAEGHLFAAIKEQNIGDAIKANLNAGVKSDLIKLDSPIKSVGEYKIPIELGKQSVIINLKVEPA